MSKESNQNISAEEEIMYRERKRLLFFGLPWTFTKYTVTPSLLTLNQGLLKTTEDDCYMYKVQDVKLTRSLVERLFGLSTIICYTGDVTNPELVMIHIRHAKEIKNYILQVSEEARRKRRTMITMDIGVRDMYLDSDD